MLRTIYSSRTNGLGWILPILNPNRSVVLVNRDKIGSNTGSGFQGLELPHGRSCEGSGVTNQVEGVLNRLIVHGLHSCRLETKYIGVLCIIDHR